jgi:hypothetical protein
VGALLGDPALVEDDDAVGGRRLGQPVGDDQGRAAGDGGGSGIVVDSGAGAPGLGGGSTVTSKVMRLNAFSAMSYSGASALPSASAAESCSEGL